MKKCEILDHYSSIVYNEEDYVFKNFVEYFNDIRHKGIYYNILGKNMNNGLYGSFALNEDNCVYVICHNETELKSYSNTTDVNNIIKIGNSFLLCIDKTNKTKKILDKKNK